MAGFAKGAKKKGIEVISFDKGFGEFNHPALQPFKDIPYVTGDALSLHEHFQDPQFDLAVSRRTLKYIVTGRRDKLLSQKKVIPLSYNLYA